MKKKVYISAYIRGNLGDDLFIKILCERYKDALFYITDYEPYKSFFAEIKNLKYIAPSTRTLNKFLYYRLKSINIEIPSLLNPPNADAHVEIGGSIYMEHPYWQKLLQERKKLLKLYKKHYVIGANWGPYHSDEFVNAYKDFFTNHEDICFRDTYSANFFSSLPHVRHADDVVFQLKHPVRESRNHYIISVIHCASRPELAHYHDDYIKKIVKITNRITEKGSEVVLMGFCEFEKDPQAIDEIYRKVKNKEKTSIYNHDNINTSLDLITSSKGIIATRFHAMILGFLFSKPTIPLIYSNKMLTILNDINFPEKYYDLKNIIDMSVDECIQQLEKKVDFDISPMIHNSEAQFQELDKLLRK